MIRLHRGPSNTHVVGKLQNAGENGNDDPLDRIANILGDTERITRALEHGQLIQDEPKCVSGRAQRVYGAAPGGPSLDFGGARPRSIRRGQSQSRRFVGSCRNVAPLRKKQIRFRKNQAPLVSDKTTVIYTW